MTTLVDNFGGTLSIFVLGIFELIAIFYFYGLEDICIDIEFMTGRRVTFYWRICWLLLSPITMSIVFIYSTITMKPLTYSGLDFPTEYVVGGWCIFLVAMIQIPLWSFYHLNRNPDVRKQSVRRWFNETQRWGPLDQTNRNEWMKYKEEYKQRTRAAAKAANHPRWLRKIYLIFGKY